MSQLKLRYFLSALLLLQMPAATTVAQMGGITSNSSRSTYTIAEITVSGLQYLDGELVKTLSGLSVGDHIRLKDYPAVSRAIKNLWSQQMFADIGVTVTKIEDNKVYLNISLSERPRLSRFSIRGISKTQETEIKDKLGIVQNRMVTEALKKDIVERIKKYYADKGFVSVKTKIVEQKDTVGGNSVAL